MRENIILKCTECGEENYINTKNKRNHPERMEVKKYCPRCNKKTTHKEKKYAFLAFFLYFERNEDNDKKINIRNNANKLLCYI